MWDVRIAGLLSLALGAMSLPAHADDAMHRVDLEDKVGYLMSVDYAAAHQADLEEMIPGPVKIDGFWTPGDTTIFVAERVFREMIHAAIKDPTLLFPDLVPDADTKGKAAAPATLEMERQRRELEAVSENFNRYERQYVGIIVDGQRLVFCNYSMGTEGDSTAQFIFTEKYFVAGKSHFLQCRYDPEAKACSNVSMIGPWVEDEKGDN